MRALLAALLGMICWGVAPIFGKLGLQGIDPLTALVGRTFIAALLIGAAALGGGRLGHLRAVPFQAWFLIALEAIFATLVGDLFYYAALKWGGAAQTTLVLSAAPLITLWVGWQFLREPLTAPRLLGAALIIAGVALVSLGQR